MLNSSPTLGVGVVGLGVGEQHAAAFASLSSCEVRWLYDLDADRTQSVLSKIGQGHAAKNYEAILGDSLVHLVSLASYDHAHYEQVVAGLRAGKHVFVEKPMCRSLEEAAAIKRTWQACNSLRLASNLVLRAAPLYRWLKQALEAGELGEVYAFDGDYLYGRLEKITHGWRKDVPNYSVMLGGGIHLVDLMLWLTGQKPVSVTAVGSRICTQGSSFRYNDYVSATYRFESGLVGRITANFGAAHRHQHVVRIFGTKATFIYDDAGARLHSGRAPRSKATPLEWSPLPSGKGDLIPSFIGSILSEDDPRNQAQREIDLISVCVAADRTPARGSSTEVEYI